MRWSRRTAVLALVALGALACHSPEVAMPTSARTEPHHASLPVALDAPLEASFARWEQEGPTGDDDHRARLQQLASAIRARVEQTKQVEVLFVCTHNSRRSHMAQLLGLAAARRKGLTGVRTFSGGTEVTAFNPRAIAALQRVGFAIAGGEGKNPHYAVHVSSTGDAVEAFSKRIVDAPNPTSGFVVVMTCSQADAACPFVQGAAARVSVPYDDPKVADDTPQEAARYDERVAQIGRDMAWVFAAVAAR
jgi:protein-tyrosine-phosphatase